MDQLRQLISLLCFLICVKAQNTTIQEADNDSNPVHPSMAVVLVVLSIMFCLTFLILAYAKFCHSNESRPFDHLPHISVNVGSRPRFSGIEKSIIESLPYFKFSSLKGSKEGLECAVCLSRFEDSELLRLLPNCRHAFHISCIDRWLENHSSCPLCRCRFDAGDIKSLRYSNSNSFREDGPNLEFFIQREQSRGRSLRFNLANTLQKLARGRRDDPLIQDEEIKNPTKVLHNVKHRIIASDVIHKSRWSDVNSSDMLSLSSEMLKVMSEKGPSSDEVRVKEQMLKIKEDMERKRVFESKIVASSSQSCSCSDNDLGSSIMSKSLDPGQKRSMSEITNLSRFKELNSNTRITGSSTSVDDKVRRAWLPIATRTIRMFSAPQTTSKATQNTLHV